jgi:hypothetical protein
MACFLILIKEISEICVIKISGISIIPKISGPDLLFGFIYAIIIR